ncbi:MAG: PglZ domain-containing protein [Bacteroidales bacterium]|jgi:CheY-like chemotaxis protein|nr:PglZ domain-containing protein [Bacteroidales bacterium]MDD2570663.1 bifunctional response regulator/alkaline phosphatase family protein [Bacteroidales bacterium]MDD3384639.1 bifunctional response regulator/alkaline phosphatase family protein [Bacteroidales bacterium]MDD3871014.1 bifunctional response regulator/alkaline phosphatase family protein [Bacteroidales bacterium]MDD4812733.1 bifunctional response regulator/alkaline phosphatase family protein [Bacteroidales bacterium]
MSKSISILWADDEIDLLRPHILLLEGKGFDVVTASNGEDAIDRVTERDFDLIFLDENMPGLTGLQVLSKIKIINPNIPVVMITKSEEEDIMDEAIGSKIADYLIKPVNPKQVLLTIKKFTDTKRLVSEKTTSAYQTEFGRIGMQINESLSWQDWIQIQRKLVFWEMELSGSSETPMDEVFRMQKLEANHSFARFIRRNYASWFSSEIGDRPILSPDVLRHKVFPLMDGETPVVLMMIDNLRYDQWKVIEPILLEYFTVEDDDLYYSILPTATQFARNAFFGGLMPLEISRLYPDIWKEEGEEGSKNLFEEELLKNHLQRLGMPVKFVYDKINTNRNGRKWVDHYSPLLDQPLSVLVYNFVDMLSHARTEMNMIRELADDEAAYRTLTQTWFLHSPMLELLRELSTQKVRVVITTDHGTVLVQDPIKIIGDRQTSTNLRYKQGKNLNYNPKEVFEVVRAEEIHLPRPNVSTRYVFATGTDFFAYPNNYNHYVKYYRNTFQHGGISLEEMIIPLIVLQSKA